MNSHTAYLIGMLAVTAGVTFILRAFPFILFGRGKSVPDVIGYIGKMVSPAAIAMLVVYCFGCYIRDNMENIVPWSLAGITAGTAVVLLQLWKGNPLLSIIGGTAVYMLLV